MADVPDQAVLWCIENVVQGDGQFDRAEVGRKVASGVRNGFDEEAAQFVRQLW